MKIIKPSVKFFGAVPTDYENALKFIEIAGRTCYKSEDKITSTSAEKFVKKLINAGHLAMVEHSNFVVKTTQEVNTKGFSTYMKGMIGNFLSTYIKNNILYVGGNLTAWSQLGFVEDISISVPFTQSYGKLFNLSSDSYSGGWQVCPHSEIPKELHRYSARFICDRGVSHELVRHRPCSFAQESTRYVNYAGKDMEFIEPAGFEGWENNIKAYFEVFLGKVEDEYAEYICQGLTPQQARAVLPNALKTEVIVTADLAEWQHIFKLRCHKSAHPDFVRLAVPLRDQFISEGIIDA